LIKKFQFLDSVDTENIQKIIGDMYDLLLALDEGRIPNTSDYSHEDLRAYLESLIKGQRKSLGSTKSGSWSVAPNDEGMPADARVEFIFRPTYIATATLSRVLCDYPLIALSLSLYRIALHRGLKFCTHRKLQGHGYDGDMGMIDAFSILSLGKVPWLLNRHPDFCPELEDIISAAAADMKVRLETGKTTGPWGTDFSEGFRSALETLRLKNGSDFM
jgi:hypothetical protein